MLLRAVSFFAGLMGEPSSRRDGRAIVAMVTVAIACLGVGVAIGIGIGWSASKKSTHGIADEDLSISAKMFERIDVKNIRALLRFHTAFHIFE